MGEICVVEIIKAISSQEKELTKALQEIVSICILEEGCLQYDLFEPIRGKGEFLVLMRWRGTKELRRHESSKHIKEFIQKYDGILYSEVRQTEWKAI